MRAVTLILKRLLALFILGMLITACADDEAFDEVTDSTNGTEETDTDSDTDTDDDLTENEDDDATALVSDQTTNLVMEWNNVWLELDQYATGMRPNATARSIAYINIAAYETAVPFMNGYQSLEKEFRGLSIDQDRARNANFKLAMNACYAKVMEHFMYNITSADAEAGISELETELQNRYSDSVGQEELDKSLSWGEYVADKVIAYSQTDQEGETQILEPQPHSYVPPTGDGFWTFSDDAERGLFPYWGSVRSFMIDPDETTTIEPIAYSEDTSSDYYAQMMEVYEANNAARDNDDEQLWIAEFWSDDVEGLMISPPGRQVSIANQLIGNFDLEIGDALSLMVKLGLSLNDAAVATWHYKYTYMVMRPSVYIHEFIDPDYQTNLYRFIYWPNPTFPGYPSGHSTFASAAAGVFIDAFGDNVVFTDRTHEGRTEFRGEPRTFGTLSEMAAENAYSRIPLGVHIRMDCDEGLRLGYEISDAVNRLDLRNRH